MINPKASNNKTVPSDNKNQKDSINESNNSQQVWKDTFFSFNHFILVWVLFLFNISWFFIYIYEVFELTCDQTFKSAVK